VGYQVLLDIIGSAITGGLLLITLLRFQAENMESKQQFRDEIIQQGNLVSIASLLEEDFRRMGYCAVRSNMAVPIVVAAAADSITFKTDFPADYATSHDPAEEGDGVVDFVTYKLGGLITSTSNPLDRMLYRRVNNGPYGGSSVGVTQFELNYMTYNGGVLHRPVTGDSLKLIASVEVTIRIQNPEPYGPTPGIPDTLAALQFNWKQMRYDIKSFGKGAI
jgi:hypothetical protein